VAATWTGVSVGTGSGLPPRRRTWWRGCIPNVASTTSRPDITCSGPMKSSGVSPRVEHECDGLTVVVHRIISPASEVSRTSKLNAETVRQAAGYLLGGYHLDPGRSQLKGQRDPVQPPDDLRHRLGIGRGELEVRSDSSGTFHEKLYG
jgi:hypothetical protein